jgi:NhaA family Na+:H+ antiporter
MKALLRSTVDHFLLLPLGGVLALIWANAAPDSYFTSALALKFWINEVAMALFFAVVAQEIYEELMPGGALHTWRRWPLPFLAAAGSLVGAAVVYLAYVNSRYELVLRDGWPIATAIDIAIVYVLVRSLFRRHPAVPFVLLVAVAANTVGLIVVASRQQFVRVDAGGITIALVAIGLAVVFRILKVRSFWPYLLVAGPLFWWALFAIGLNPAFALVPIVPFLRHAPRSLVLFEDKPHSAHDSRTHFEHVFLYPVHIVLFLFGLVNAGVLLTGYGTGTWALLAASLVGKPIGLLAGTALGVALGLHLPRGLHWRDLIVVALATTGVFAFGLFFATAVYPLGPVQSELKLGAILSGIGVPLTFLAAWLWRVGIFHTPHHGHARHHAHHPHPAH